VCDGAGEGACTMMAPVVWLVRTERTRVGLPTHCCTRAKRGAASGAPDTRATCAIGGYVVLDDKSARCGDERDVGAQRGKAAEQP